MTAPVVVNGRGARRARRGHPWIYRDDVIAAPDDARGLAAVVDRSERFLCWAAFSRSSRIALRRVSTASAPPDDAFWSAAIDRALALRGPAVRAGAGCARLLHADSDGFPGLVVDRYGEHLVLQATTAWADGVAAAFGAALAARAGAISVLARNDPAVRELERLPRETRQLAGVTPGEIEVEEAGVRRFVDPWHGHKTGLYLDQQDNHRKAPQWLGGRTLDLFSGEGGFALPLAAAGRRVVAVEQSRALVERARRSLARNGIDAGAIEWIADNAFDVLTGLERDGERFDAVVLDPPPFARRRHEADGAYRGYKDLHRRALRVLAPGGRLLTFSCSFAIGEADFEAIVREAAEEAEADVRVVARPGAAADHPETLLLPESRYLKGLLLERRAE